MAKRRNRLKAIAHEERQLEMLATLVPNATPQVLRPVSNQLLTIARVCLDGVYDLELNGEVNRVRFTRLYVKVQELADMLAVETEVDGV